MVGELIVPPLFSGGYFSIKTEIWRSEISWLILIVYYKLSEIQKKWFFTVLFGDLEGAGTINPILNSINIQKPPNDRGNFNSGSGQILNVAWVNRVNCAFTF